MVSDSGKYGTIEQRLKVLSSLDLDILPLDQVRWNERENPLETRGIQIQWIEKFAEVTHCALPLMTGREFVERVIEPLTYEAKIPLYARVPAQFRAPPETFISHVWDNDFACVGHYSTLGGMLSLGAFPDQQEPVWLDLISYNQHRFEDVTSDMKIVLLACKHLKLALTTQPFFHRMWCLWELLCAYNADIPVTVYDTSVRLRKYMGSEGVFARPDFRSIGEAKTTNQADADNIMSALRRTFGSVAAADHALSAIVANHRHDPQAVRLGAAEGLLDSLRAAEMDEGRHRAALRAMSLASSETLKRVASLYLGSDRSEALVLQARNWLEAASFYPGTDLGEVLARETRNRLASALLVEFDHRKTWRPGDAAPIKYEDKRPQWVPPEPPPSPRIRVSPSPWYRLTALEAGGGDTEFACLKCSYVEIIRPRDGDDPSYACPECGFIG